MRHQNTAWRECGMAADFHWSCQIDHAAWTDGRIVTNGEMAEPFKYLNKHRLINPDPTSYVGAEQMQASRTKTRMNTPPQEFFHQHPYTDQDRIKHVHIGDRMEADFIHRASSNGFLSEATVAGSRAELYRN